MNSIGRLIMTIAAIAAVIVIASVPTTAGSDAKIPDFRNNISGEHSYAKWADYLRKQAPEGDRKQLIYAARSLFGTNQWETMDESARDIVRGFISLFEYIGPDACARTKLFYDRTVAEAMHAGGNLEPDKISESARWLNRIVIVYLLNNRGLCYEKLTARSQTKYTPQFGDPKLNATINFLVSIPQSFLLPDFIVLERYDSVEWQTAKDYLAKIMVASDPDSPAPGYLEQASRLRTGLANVCPMFAFNSILDSYADLLAVTRIVDPQTGVMGKFYESQTDRPYMKAVTENQGLRQSALAKRACIRFTQINDSNLVKLLRRLDTL